MSLKIMDQVTTQNVGIGCYHADEVHDKVTRGQGSLKIMTITGYNPGSMNCARCWNTVYLIGVHGLIVVDYLDCRCSYHF